MSRLAMFVLGLLLGLGSDWGSPPAILEARTFLVDGVQITTLQAGIDSAAAGDTVLVAGGTWGGAGNRDLDFNGKDLVLKSVLGADQTTIDSGGSPAEPHRAFDFHSGETVQAVVEGFTITGGVLTGGQSTGSGTGIRIRQGSGVTVLDCVVAGNVSVDDVSGGGISVEENSELVLTRCSLIGNTAVAGAGLGCLGGSTVTITDCLITGNQGGGIFCDDQGTTLDVIGTTISGNMADSVGGGIFSISAPTVTVERSIIWGNCSPVNSGNEIYVQLAGNFRFTCSVVDTSTSAKVYFADAVVRAFDADVIADDPLFCAPEACQSAPSESGNYALAVGSPCLAASSPCGQQMGALGLGIGCGTVSALPATWGELKARYRRPE